MTNKCNKNKNPNNINFLSSFINDWFFHVEVKEAQLIIPLNKQRISR